MLSANKWGLVDMRKTKLGSDFIEIWKSYVLMIIDFNSAFINLYELQGDCNTDAISSLVSGASSMPSSKPLSSAPIKLIMKLSFRAISKCYLVVDKIHFEIEERIYYFDIAIAKSRNLPLFRYHRFRIHTSSYLDALASLSTRNIKSRKDYELEASSWVEAIQSIAESEKSFHTSRMDKFSSSSSSSSLMDTFVNQQNNSTQDEPLPPPKPPKPRSLAGKSTLDSQPNSFSPTISAKTPPPPPPRPGLRPRSGLECPGSVAPPTIPPRPSRLSASTPPIPPRPPSLALLRTQSIGDSGRKLYNITMENSPPPLPPRPKKKSGS